MKTFKSDGKECNVKSIVPGSMMFEMRDEIFFLSPKSS